MQQRMTTVLVDSSTGVEKTFNEAYFELCWPMLEPHRLGYKAWEEYSLSLPSNSCALEAIVL